MSDQFIGEIKMVGFSFSPVNWAYCDGALMDIGQNPALYSLIGTTYGGDGVTNFALPDMKDRIPIHYGSGIGLTTRPIGQSSGTSQVTLTIENLPLHNHNINVTNTNASSSSPANNLLGKSNYISRNNSFPFNMYTQSEFDASLNSNSISNTGGNQPHNNIMPSTVINFIIALDGLYPARN